MSGFKKASKEKARLRMAVLGPAGSGKTYTALRIGSAIAKARGKRLAFIDTERGSASKYADQFDFDVLELEDFAPSAYAKAIKSAADDYGCVVVDSLSHAWSGSGGALDMADKASARGGNKFAAWREVTPAHNGLVEAMLQSPIDVIATMRTKMEYVQEKDDRGKTTIRKVGMQPIQREGMEYEFDVVGDMDVDHNLIITKTRCGKLDKAVIAKPGEDLATALLEWLGTGVEPAQRLPSLAAPLAPDADSAEIAVVKDIGLAQDEPSLAALIGRIKALDTEAQGRVKQVYASRKRAIAQAPAVAAINWIGAS